MTEYIRELVAPHYEWFYQELVPNAIVFWQRLEVPPWEIYSSAVHEFTVDWIDASQSTGKLAYLTLRPFAILTWILLQALWKVAQVLFKVLLEQGWISLKKGAMQAKVAILWFYRFQRSLSRTEVLGELALITTCILLYYLRKWLKRQTYVARATQWYRQKKQKVVQSCTRIVHRVAKVSIILAMTVPHVSFLGGYVAFKILFPSVIQWLAYDTYLTALLSVVYPLIYTLSYVHERRNGEKKPPESPSSIQTASSSSPTNLSVQERARAIINKSSAEETSRFTTARQRRKAGSASPSASEEAKTPLANRRGKRVIPVTSPASISRKADASSPRQFAASNKDPINYWLRYWGIFAMLQSIGTFGSMVPVFGRFVAQHPFILSTCAELRLLFFIWLFTMEMLLGNVAEDAFLAEAMPLRIIYRHVTPILLEFECVVSEAVSKNTWRSVVHSKCAKVFEVFVMIKLLSATNKDWLLHVIDEGRTLVLPSLTLFMPGFITQFGVAYVQFIVPTAKSSRCKDEATQLLYLQYWILHCMLSGLLSYFSGIIWWIPFSTHAIFVLWAHLSFPRTINDYYGIVETELMAFGLLPGEGKMAVHETRTVQLFQALYERLPSAKSEDLSVDASKDDSDTKNDTPEKKDPPAIDPSISFDSQRVEVSITPKVESVLTKKEPALFDQESTSSQDENKDPSTTPKSLDNEDDLSTLDLVNKTSTTREETSSSDDSSVDGTHKTKLGPMRRATVTKAMSRPSNTGAEPTRDMATKTSMSRDKASSSSDSSIEETHKTDKGSLRRSTRVRKTRPRPEMIQ